MENLLHSEIFFFITTIFVVVLITVLIIGGVYLIKVLRNFSTMSRILKDGVMDAENELREMGTHVSDSPVFKFIFGSRRKKPQTKGRHTTKGD